MSKDGSRVVRTGFLLEMWRIKMKKWYSNRLYIYFSYFQNTTVILHKWKVIVTRHSIKKLYPTHCLFFLFSFSFPRSSLSPLFFFLLFSLALSPLSFVEPLGSCLVWSADLGLVWSVDLGLGWSANLSLVWSADLGLRWTRFCSDLDLGGALTLASVECQSRLGWSAGVGLGLCGDYLCDFLCGNCGVGFVCGVIYYVDLGLI